MKIKVLSFLCLLIIALGIGTSGKASIQSSPELPLRLGDSTEIITTDLETFIPQYMREQDIPGVGIALIRDNKVVWSEGYGVTNSITRKPVTPETVFAMASNSKVVTTYIALRLVDQGKLSLDQSLNTYLSQPWLPDSPYRDQITLRHVTSHSSGLTQTGQKSLFAPGSAYYYSGMGISYLQTVIEQVTDQSLETLARDLVFEPLDMGSASYVNRSDLIPIEANGHIYAIAPVLFFCVVYAFVLLIVTLLGLLVSRLRKGIWRPTGRTVSWWCIIAFLLSLLLFFPSLSYIGLLDIAWLIAFCGIVILIILTATIFIGSRLAQRFIPDRSRLRTAIITIMVFTVLAGIAFLSIKTRNLPVPKWSPAKADGVSSLRANTFDMAKFMLELSNPQLLSPELAQELRTPQIHLANDLSWGLGPGIQHSQEGDALWQWGQHIHFQSLMIIYPDHGFGVVVSTNNDLLNPDVALEIAQRALGGPIETIRQAVHLEFNYRQ